MGNWASIKMHADSPSLAEPGEMSAVSDPIDKELVDDPQEFFSELLEMIRDPVHYLLMEHYFLKEVVYKEDDPDHYSFRVILDGQKLKRVLPDKANEDDVCRTWMAVAVDRNLMHMETRDFEPDKDTEVVRYTCNTRFHVDEEGRLRVEVWGFDPEGVRRSGSLVAYMVREFHLKPLLLPRIARSVKVRSNIEMSETGGRSALSEPLDDYFTAEGFFEAVVKNMKEEAINNQAEVQYRSESEFVASWRIPSPLPQHQEQADGGKMLQVTKDTVTDPQSLQICVTERIEDELTLTHFYRVTRDPPRCEFWQMLPNGHRVGGGPQAYMLRLLLMKLIDEEKVRDQIEGLQKDENNFMF